MIRKIDAVISTNKDLLNLKDLVDQILNQKGNFDINIILIHQYKKNIIYQVF